MGPIVGLGLRADVPRRRRLWHRVKTYSSVIYCVLRSAAELRYRGSPLAPGGRDLLLRFGLRLLLHDRPIIDIVRHIIVIVARAHPQRGAADPERDIRPHCFDKRLLGASASERGSGGRRSGRPSTSRGSGRPSTGSSHGSDSASGCSGSGSMSGSRWRGSGRHSGRFRRPPDVAATSAAHSGTSLRRARQRPRRPRRQRTQPLRWPASRPRRQQGRNKR